MNSLVPLVSFEQYWQSVGATFSKAPGAVGDFGNRIPQRPDANGLFMPRAGYMLLCFDNANAEPKLSDLASSIGQLRYSRAAGNLYLRDWDVVVMGRLKNPDVPSQEMTATILGELSGIVPNEASSIDSLADFRRYVDPNAKPQIPGPLPADRQNVRTWRLYEIASHLKVSSPQLASRLEAFRRDYPDDSGADMVVTCLTMAPQNTEINAATAPVIADSADRLYRSLRDPFLLYVQWLAARSQQNEAVMQRLEPAIREAGFETVELHRTLLDRAVASQDSTKVVAALNDIGRYWNPDGAIAQKEPDSEIKRKWGVTEDRLARASQTSASGSGSNNSRRPNFRGPGGAASRSRFGGNTAQPPESGSGTGSGQPPSSDGGSPAESTDNWVVEIHSDESFDVNRLATDLTARLGVKGHRAMRRNNQGEIQFAYSGTTEDLRNAIDFGTIDSMDASKRRVSLTLKK